MRILNRDLRYRHVVRGTHFTDAFSWPASATGKRATIVRFNAAEKGDAHDPSRSDALYAIEHFNGDGHSVDLPELAGLAAFEDYDAAFLMARRLQPSGDCTPDGEVICIPQDSRWPFGRPPFFLDLVGYGPERWYPDGVSGKEIAERGPEPWKAIIWQRPDAMVGIHRLHYGCVVRSEQFTRVVRRGGSGPDEPLVLYSNHEERERPEFADAPFVIEDVEPAYSEWSDGSDDPSDFRMTLRRLCDDGSYDSDGCRITLTQHAPSHGRHSRQHSPFQPVEFLGYASFTGAPYAAAKIPDHWR